MEIRRDRQWEHRLRGKRTNEGFASIEGVSRSIARAAKGKIGPVEFLLFHSFEKSPKGLSVDFAWGPPKRCRFVSLFEKDCIFCTRGGETNSADSLHDRRVAWLGTLTGDMPREYTRAPALSKR